MSEFTTDHDLQAYEDMAKETWEERFDKKVKLKDSVKNIKKDEYYEIMDFIVKQFISDIRKEDLQQLLLKLSLEMQYYGREVEMKISKIVEQHYAN